jgi:hypothetical protein
MEKKSEEDHSSCGQNKSIAHTHTHTHTHETQKKLNDRCQKTTQATGDENTLLPTIKCLKKKGSHSCITKRPPVGTNTTPQECAFSMGRYRMRQRKKITHKPQSRNTTVEKEREREKYTHARTFTQHIHTHTHTHTNARTFTHTHTPPEKISKKMASMHASWTYQRGGGGPAPTGSSRGRIRSVCALCGSGRYATTANGTDGGGSSTGHSR